MPCEKENKSTRKECSAGHHKLEDQAEDRAKIYGYHQANGMEANDDRGLEKVLLLVRATAC